MEVVCFFRTGAIPDDFGVCVERHNFIALWIEMR